jgi:hypothetical protein
MLKKKCICEKFGRTIIVRRLNCPFPHRNRIVVPKRARKILPFQKKLIKKYAGRPLIVNLKGIEKHHDWGEEDKPDKATCRRSATL